MSARHAPTLPQLPTPLIGRDEDLAETRQRLKDGRRLVTLTGPPGVGKTSLALNVGHAVSGQYRYGVRLVNLAPVEDPALVVAAIADALGVRRSVEQPALEQVIRFIRDRRLLLVLDNFEQVVDAAPIVAELLTSCPLLAVLVTSRVPLSIRWETELAIGPLPLPDPALGSDPAALAEVPAVALFVQRAQTVRPDFRLTEENAAIVSELCTLLDGLPLAIELAAARVRTLSLGVLRASLADTDGDSPGQTRLTPLELLVDGSRDLPTRQQSLRQFGVEQLADQGERDAVRQRHAAYFLGLAERAEPELVGHGQLEWLDRLAQDQANLEAATQWAVEQADPRIVLRLGAALRRFWWSRGDNHETRLRIATILIVARAGPPTIERARALQGAGTLAHMLGNYAVARLLLEEGRRVGEAIGDRFAVAAILFDLGHLAYVQGDYLTARQQLEASLAIFRELDGPPEMAATLVSLGYLATVEGADPEARARFEESLAVARAHDDQRGVADAMHGLGRSYHVEGALDLARQYYEQSLQLFQMLGDRHSAGMALGDLGSVAAMGGDVSGARRLYRAALDASRVAGNRRRLAYTVAAVAGLAAAHDPERALRLDTAATLALEAIGARQAPFFERLWASDLDRARAALGEARAAESQAGGRSLTLDEAIDEALDWLGGDDGDDLAVDSSVSDSPPARSSALIPPSGPVDGRQVGSALTRREREVAMLLGRGLTTNREIAAELVVAEITAGSYVQRVMTRLGLRSRAQVAAWAAGQQLDTSSRP
ncbi:MAG TPA: tetratricopeptide repeat protein [Chloroflexota bacterium]|nr:tetratricopeptide repeat protein [Chloroflexota bacterium]